MIGLWKLSRTVFFLNFILFIFLSQTNVLYAQQKKHMTELGEENAVMAQDES